MTPGDGFGVDPIIQRGEELERKHATAPGLSLEEIEELVSIKAYAHARLAHLKQYPLADTMQEEEAQYLAEQEARSAREREQEFFAVLRKSLDVLEPVALAAFHGLLTQGVASLQVPPQLAGVVQVVQAAAENAAQTVLNDVHG